MIQKEGMIVLRTNKKQEKTLGRCRESKIK